MLKVRIISPVFQACKASSKNVLEGHVRALWLCTLKREETSIYGCCFAVVFLLAAPL